jgi:DNA-directed RNA polymerase subunit N (RpoN/RPB10)
MNRRSGRSPLALRFSNKYFVSTPAATNFAPSPLISDKRVSPPSSIKVTSVTFRVFVTSCSHPPQEIWRDYNRRADMENRIAELKHDLGADGFCLKQFFATEAAFRAVSLLFNLLAEFQRAAGLPVYREPATIRTQILTCGAILGRSGRRLVLHLSQNWGGLTTRIPLLESIVHWHIPTSPKLQPVLIT